MRREEHELVKRNVGDIDHEFSDDQLGAIEGLWAEFVAEHEDEPDEFTETLLRTFERWLDEGDRWERIPVSEKDERGRDSEDPRMRDLTVQLLAATRHHAVCVFVLCVLTTAMDQKFRLGDPTEAGVDTFHRVTPVGLAR